MVPHRSVSTGSYVALAKKLLDGKAKVCAVIGFPLGAMSTAAKAFEAAEAIPGRRR